MVGHVCRRVGANGSSRQFISRTNALNMAEAFKSPRPLPLLVNDSTFSHKKARKGAHIEDCLPPRPPVKSAPPVSRIFKHTRKHSEGAHGVSFSDNGSSILQSFFLNNLFCVLFWNAMEFCSSRFIMHCLSCSLVSFGASRLK